VGHGWGLSFLELLRKSVCQPVLQLDVADEVENFADKRLGESLRTIREGERQAPLASVSGEAFALYRQAVRARATRDADEAIELLQRAVSIDPSFAVAWHKLGSLAHEKGDAATARGAYQAVVDLWDGAEAADRTVRDLRSRIAALD